jgi:hypothetical protein
VALGAAVTNRYDRKGLSRMQAALIDSVGQAADAYDETGAKQAGDDVELS